MTRGDFWALLGTSAGEAFAGYAALLMFACLGPTILALVLHALLRARDRGATVVLALELVYGLVNPVMYLLVFQPGLFRSATPAALSFLQVTTLAAYWGWRLVGRWVPASERVRRGVGVSIAAAAVLLVIGTAARDLVITVVAPPDLNSLPVVVLLLAPLYLFPVWIGTSQLRRRRLEEFQSRAGLFVAWTFVGSAAVLAVLANLGQSTDVARSSSAGDGEAPWHLTAC